MKILLVVIIGFITVNMSSMTLKRNIPNMAKSSFISAEVPLQGTRWNLVSLSNANTALDKTPGTAYLILNKDSTVTGNGGCNSFDGKYSLGKDNAIYFGEMARTNLSCSAIDLERRFINALAKTDNYYVKGDTLSLNRGRFNSLVKFVAAQ